MKNTNSRIKILDGFRALAIIAVLLFHFFSRWLPNSDAKLYYPYKDQYDYFHYGYLGVEFFFIISGFVIFFTLEYTDTFINFWKKRLIRLFPSIVIASIIIFIFFKIFDENNLFPGSQKIENVAVSITFIRPQLIENILNIFNIKVKVDYVNASFWSLWPEIQFYFLASMIYFLNKKNFIRNFLLISVFLILVNLFIHSLQGQNRLHLDVPKSFFSFYEKWVDFGFNLIRYLPFFVLGILNYSFYKNFHQKEKNNLYNKITYVFIMSFILLMAKTNSERIFFVLMFLLFYLFIYFSKALSFFEKIIFAKIGESSYFLYLIHENIGVFIIFTIGAYFLPYGFILPIILMILLTLISVFYTKIIDKKINIWLKNKILKKKF